MDPQIINALILNYLSKEDKALAETWKTKLNAYVAPKGCPNIEEVFEYYQKNALKKLPKMVSKVQSDDLDYEFDDEKPAAVKRTRSETFSGPVVSFHGSQKLSLSHQIGTQIEPAGIADDRASASSINTVIVGRQTPKRMRSSRFHQNEQYNTIAKASVHRLISEITHSISQETYKFTVASFDGLQSAFETFLRAMFEDANLDLARYIR